MTPEENIANLIASANTLVNLYRDKEAAISARIDAETSRLAANAATYMQQVGASLYKTFYVDPVNGNDTNSGTQASPLATVAKAVSLIPYGGGGQVSLLPGNHYIDRHIYTSRRAIVFKGVDINQAEATRLLFHQKADGTVPATGGMFYIDSAGGAGNSLLFRDCSLIVNKPLDTVPSYHRTFVTVIGSSADVQFGEFGAPAGKSSVYVTAQSRLEDFKMVHSDRASVHFRAMFTNFLYVNKVAQGNQKIQLTSGSNGSFAAVLAVNCIFDGFDTANADVNTLRLGNVVIPATALKTAGGYDY